jgi:translation initiation factor IF-2
MAEEKTIRLGQASRKLNVGHNTILDFLAEKGFDVENNPNAKLTSEQFAMLSKEYASSASEKAEASGLTIGVKHIEATPVKPEPEVHRKKKDEEESVLIKNLGSKDIVKPKEEPKPEKVELEKPKLEGFKVVGKIDLEKKKTKKAVAAEIKQPEKETEKEVVAEAPAEKPVEQELEVIKARAGKLQGLKVVDKIQLPVEKKKEQPVASSDLSKTSGQKRPRKRLPNANEGNRGPGPAHRSQPQRPFVPRQQKAEPTDKEIQDQIRATLAKLSGNTKKTSGAKYRKEKRQAVSDAEEERLLQEQRVIQNIKGNGIHFCQ